MGRARHAALLIAALGLSAFPAVADPPLSVIDWLSQSTAAPGDPVALPSDDTSDPAEDTITVTTLEAPRADAAGILSPSLTGLPRALWGPASTDDVIARIEAVPRDLLPALSELFTVLLLAEANPPRGPANDDRLLLARVDRLLERGALDRAGALLDQAGVTTSERFRRRFDVALLEGTETEACKILLDRPGVTPTHAARVFCLARGGDWPAAALVLESANSLGLLSRDEDLLLARFLDPEIIGEIAFDRYTPSPLTFRMLEAIGEPQPTGPLPLAFAWADLRPTRGWKAQLEAAERLGRQGVLSGNLLFGLYQRKRPSASGGVWERAKTIQALQSALAEPGGDGLANAASKAWSQMEAAGLGPMFANQYGAELAQLGLDGAPGALAIRIGLMSNAYERVAIDADPDADVDPFLIALARGVPETALARDPLSLAVREGFQADGPPPAMRPYLNEGRTGEAILIAITQFAEGVDGDPDGISDAVALLRSLGLHKAARRASIELLLNAAPS